MRIKHLFYVMLAMLTFVACDKEMKPTPQPEPKPEPVIPSIEITDVVINNTTATICFTATSATEVKGVAVKSGQSVEIDTVLSNGIAAEGDTITIEGLEYITEYDFYVATTFENGDTALSEKFTCSTDYEPMPPGDYTEIHYAYGYVYDGSSCLMLKFYQDGTVVSELTIDINFDEITYIIPEGEYIFGSGDSTINSENSYARENSNKASLDDIVLKVEHLEDKYLFELYAESEHGKIYSTRWIGRLDVDNIHDVRNPGDDIPSLTDNEFSGMTYAWAYVYNDHISIILDCENGATIILGLNETMTGDVLPEGEFNTNNDTMTTTSTSIVGPVRYNVTEAAISIQHTGDDNYIIEGTAKDEGNNVYNVKWDGFVDIDFYN